MASIVDDRGYNQGFVPTPALEVRTDRRCAALIAEMDLTKKRQILELGCGTGELSHLLATKTDATVVGTDLCLPFIEQARQKYVRENLSYEVIDLNNAEHVTRLAGRFDYVVGNGILHHVYDNLDSVLLQLKGLIQPGGKIVFWEPNLLNPYVMTIFKIGFMRKVAKLEPDEMAFTPAFIRRKLEKAGFTSLNVTTRDFLLPNTPAPLIDSAIALGAALEKIPALSWCAQSLFISATRPG